MISKKLHAFRTLLFTPIPQIDWGFSAITRMMWYSFFPNTNYPRGRCKRNVEMTPLCKIEVTPARVQGSREVRRGGVVDEQAGVQASGRAVAGTVGSPACQ